MVNRNGETAGCWLLTTDSRQATFRLPVLTSLLLVLGLALPALTADVKPLVDKFQAQSPAEGQAAAAEILKLGAEGVKGVCGMLTPPSTGGDEKAHFALHGVVLWSMRPGADAERKMVEGVLDECLAAAQDAEIKAFLLEQLRFLATDASIPVISGLLGDDRLCEPATHILTTLQTPAASDALASHLAKAKGKNLLTIVRALGVLRVKSAAAAILPYATSEDALLHQTAWYALANMGEPKALEPIKKASEGKALYERSLATRSLMLLVQRLAEQGDKATCMKVCRDLIASRTDPAENHVICQALATLAENAGSDALPDLLARLDDKDIKIREAVLQSLVLIKGPGVSAKLAELLPNARPDVRAILVRALGLQKDPSAKPALEKALKDENAAVRLAAIGALAEVGGVDVLIAALAQAQADEAKAIRDVLSTSQAEGLTAALGGALPKASADGQITILGVLGERKAADQSGAVFDALKSSDAKVKSAAAKALAQVVEQKDVPRILELLLAETDAGLRLALGRALANAARKGTPDAKPVVAALSKAPSEETRVELISVLARIGGPDALKAATAEAASESATVREGTLRALGDWCDAGAAPVLLKLMKEAKERKQQVLALRGCLRAIGLSESDTPEQKASLLKDVLSATQVPEDKRLVLGALGGVTHPDAVTLAASCLGDDALKEDAAAAIVRSACPGPETKGLSGAAIVDALKKTIAATGNDEFKKKAQDYLATLATGSAANLAKGKPVKTTVGQEGGQAPEKAVDGNTDRDAAWFGQKWPCSLEVDLQKPEKIQGVGVWFYHDGGRYYQFNVEASLDGKEYKQLVDMSKNTTPSTEKGTQHAFAPIEARYVKINILKNSANQAVHLAELKVYGEGGVPEETAEAPKVQLAPPDAEGFIPLFNGNDLSGWVGAVKGYGVENGVIYCDPKTGGNLYTEAEFDDFIFKFDFKLPPGANNGVGIRSSMQGDAAYSAMEIQVLDDTAEQYAKLQPWQYHGSVYGLVPAKRGFQKPVGEWNTEEIHAIGRKIKVILNGTVIVDCDLDEVKKNGDPANIKKHPGMDRTSGHIGFLGHGARVEFRNIKIKPVEPYTMGPHNVPPEGFVALFNGKDLTGWKGLVADPPKRAKMTPEQLAEAEKKATEEALKHWKIEDGTIVYDGKNNSLCTAKDYANFEMYVDWKIHAGGDSGIYLRGSPQVQIWDPAKWPEGSGGLYNNQKNPRKPLKCADHPIGQWNRFHIKMVGEKVWVWLNDELVVDNVTMENYWERNKPIYPTGQIELQHHGSTLWFRNIFIKELP